MQARYPGLSGWRGIGGLKESLRLLAGSLPDLPVLLANRSAQLMKLAGRLLFQSCRNVLVTDIGWPPYHDILAAEGVRTGRTFTLVPVRDLVMRERTTEDEFSMPSAPTTCGSGAMDFSSQQSATSE